MLDWSAIDWQTLTWQWPWALGLLLLLPLMVWWYLNDRREAWQQAYRFSQTAVLEHLQRNTSAWQRLREPLLTILVMICLILAMARPTVTAKVTTHAVNMMLVMDISLSMLAQDMPPNRIHAAKEAASEFVNSLPTDVRIGLELFAGNNYVVKTPTTNHGEVAAYLNTLNNDHLQPRTEIGSALQSALQVLSGDSNQPASGKTSKPKNKKPPQQVIVLLSDGDSQEGYPWRMAAAHAKDQRITIYTVGVGGEAPTTIQYQGMTLPVFFSEATLREIAKITNGEYFRVFEANDFKQVYQQVKEKAVVVEEQPLELSALLSAMALGLMLTAFLLRRLT